MQWIVDLKMLLLIGIANGTPILSQKLFGDRLAFPIDGGRKLRDGEPLLGHAKSVRGVVLSVLVSCIAGLLIDVGWLVGALVGVMAMLGDMLSSFVKRRMRLVPSSMALGLDQVPESLFPLLACAPFLHLTVLDVVGVVLVFFVLELFVSKLLFRLHLRDRPY